MKTTIIFSCIFLFSITFLNRGFSEKNHTVQIDSFIPEFLAYNSYPNEVARGYSIIPDAFSQGYFIAGQWENMPAIWYYNEFEKVVWAKKIEGVSGVRPHIARIFQTDDGLLIGVGKNFAAAAEKGSNFVFSFDPITLELNWFKIYDGQDDGRFDGLFELEDGNYLLYGRLGPFSTLGGEDQLLITLDKSTGSLLDQRLISQGNTDGIRDVQEQGDRLYMLGCLRNGGLEGIRISLSAYDKTTEEFDWVKTYLFSSEDEIARLYGEKMVIEDNAIFMLSYGSLNNSNSNFFTLQLTKVDLEGNIEWSKNYEEFGSDSYFANQILSIPSGFLLVGRFRNDQGLLNNVVIQTNKNGEFQGAFKIIGDGTFGNAAAFTRDDRLYMTGIFSVPNFPTVQQMFAKVKIGDGSLSSVCPYFTAVDIIESDINNAGSEEVTPDQLVENLTLSDLPVTVEDFVTIQDVDCRFTIVNSIERTSFCENGGVRFPTLIGNGSDNLPFEFAPQLMDANTNLVKTTLYNEIGQPIRSWEGSGWSWDGSLNGGLANGIYYYQYQVSCATGHQIFTGKVVWMK